MNITLIASVCALLLYGVLLIALVVLIKKGILSVNGLAKIDEVLEALKSISSHDGVDIPLFDLLLEYVYQAVHAAQQMYKSGQITAEERKETALNIIADFAEKDGIPFTPEMRAEASNLIEAECDLMGHGTAISITG